MHWVVECLGFSRDGAGGCGGCWSHAGYRLGELGQMSGVGRSLRLLIQGRERCFSMQVPLIVAGSTCLAFNIPESFE